MSDPTLCRGLDANGNQCICMRAKDTYVDEHNRTRCTNCDHIESAHPEPKPSVTSFVKGFRDAAKLGSSSSISAPVKASHEEAEAETSAGLRPKKRKSDTSIDPPPKKPNKSAKGKASIMGKVQKTEGELVKYNKAVFLPYGLSYDGSLRKSKLPGTEEMQDMRAAGLVVFSSPTNPLTIDTAWSNAEANTEVARLFPKAMAFLARKTYIGNPNDPPEIKSQLWLAGIAHRQNITLAADALPTGVELANHCKILGRPISDRVLYIVSKVKIPQYRWKWDQSDSDEDLGSEIDTVPSEDITMTPRKPAPQKKPKIKAEPGLNASTTESDMRKAAQMRTRLSTGTIKKKAIFIPASSEVEEEPQAGPSGSTKEVVEVSDDEVTFPSALGLWKSPLHIKSPSPAPSLAPLSPNQDPPSFYEDFTIHSPPPLQESSLPVASSSSSSSTSAPSTSFSGPSTSSTSASGFTAPTWTSTSWMMPDTGAETPNIPLPPAPPAASSADEKAPRFKKMGKGRG
ncbi:hypothetical protein B0H14DRAFT_2606572 [Mycena olivaceomarginata]|nr:hypothetical protein B0H14DRAFT_2606559 [Mycena olivaceomarginata]KAJ7811409.1 hypothetical protein B0H14DRAFT_3479747 [Mycena olivaceomarginata]KAJ7811417.1 hypothetical protein B0H14DRAFT_3479755 [Mycena olivaceomarginata]KAJ7811423.1 hypothetical protein B0H14DRAFT_2606572 [Mycena olivaceomarginata]